MNVVCARNLLSDQESGHGHLFSLLNGNNASVLRNQSGEAAIGGPLSHAIRLTKLMECTFVQREQLISSVKEIVAKFDLTAAEALLFVQISISAKGDRAFCSEECRQKQIFMDEEGMKRNHCSFSATAAASNRSKPRKNGGKDTASVAGRLAC
ncbi:hypothetical protein ZIOFF_032121 [Zingiber officinale]|uniref:FLZ-type domain-containing protein n=1 Tax=Zingiber officinale TaxID=94328 RepID=A0A8J5GIK7_ZINOF|nr:hypothetical protein ZIOFF_032121 [Zingiber officinale]